MNPIKKIYYAIKMRLVKRKFDSGDYLDAYTSSTNVKAKIDPGMAIGGLWDEMGARQFDFLVSQGLLPEHKLLDIGCGSLRGGIRFIDYLEQGNYYGFDLSSEVIAAGRSKVKEAGLDHKAPNLFVNEEKNLRFDFLDGQKFDFLLAQSVFSHLKPPHIEECFANLGKVMYLGSKFYFTHHPGTEYRARSSTDFEYPHSFFAELAEKYGLKISDLSEEYEHPRGQRMLMVQF